MKPDLQVVGADEAPKPAQTVADRVRSLQAEARTLALEHARGMAGMMADLGAMAAEINAGGEAYPAGIRAVARDVAQACASSGQMLEAITARSA